MADLTGILGTMLATGRGGSSRGPAFSASPFGMGGSGGLGGLGSGLAAAWERGRWGCRPDAAAWTSSMSPAWVRSGTSPTRLSRSASRTWAARVRSQPQAPELAGRAAAFSADCSEEGREEQGRSGGSLSDRLSSVFSPGQRQKHPNRRPIPMSRWKTSRRFS